MMRDEIKNKINLKRHQIYKKKNRNQTNEDETQNKYKLEDTTEFLKALHEYQGPEEKKKGDEEKD
jgi:hypothetical protein